MKRRFPLEGAAFTPPPLEEIPETPEIPPASRPHKDANSSSSGDCGVHWIDATRLTSIGYLPQTGIKFSCVRMRGFACACSASLPAGQNARFSIYIWRRVLSGDGRNQNKNAAFRVNCLASSVPVQGGTGLRTSLVLFV